LKDIDTPFFKPPVLRPCSNLAICVLNHIRDRHPLSDVRVETDRPDHLSLWFRPAFEERTMCNDCQAILEHYEGVCGRLSDEIVKLQNAVGKTDFGPLAWQVEQLAAECEEVRVEFDHHRRERHWRSHADAYETRGPLPSWDRSRRQRSAA